MNIKIRDENKNEEYDISSNWYRIKLNLNGYQKVMMKDRHSVTFKTSKKEINHLQSKGAM